MLTLLPKNVLGPESVRQPVGKKIPHRVDGVGDLIEDEVLGEPYRNGDPETARSIDHNRDPQERDELVRMEREDELREGTLLAGLINLPEAEREGAPRIAVIDEVIGVKEYPGGERRRRARERTIGEPHGDGEDPRTDEVAGGLNESPPRAGG